MTMFIVYNDENDENNYGQNCDGNNVATMMVKITTNNNNEIIAMMK